MLAWRATAQHDLDVGPLSHNVGQTNYGAAKAAIAAFTIIAARELRRYGITVHAISPSAQTRMTEACAC